MTLLPPRFRRSLSPSRRRFLQFSAAALSGAVLSNCRGGVLTEQPTSNQPTTESTGVLTGGSPSVNASDPKTLYMYTWADYVDEDLHKAFTEQTGIQIVADIYDSNEMMLAKLQAGGGSQYSIIHPSDYMVRQMIDLKLLAKLDPTRITGLNRLLSKWQSPAYDPNNTHSVPKSWGTTGLIFNRKTLTPAPTDWSYLWDNQDQLTGRISLIDDIREVMGATLKSLGYSYNSTNPQEIEAAYNRLVELKPAIATFKTTGFEDQLISGDLTVAMTYSTLGNALPAEQPDFQYIIPTSGSSLWTDTMAIPVNAPNPEAAYAWINFNLQPENASQVVEKLQIATPLQAAIDLLPAKLTSNQTLFPHNDVLGRCEVIAPVGEATALYEKYWTQLTSV